MSTSHAKQHAASMPEASLMSRLGPELLQEVVTWLPPSDSATAALVNKRFNLAVRMNVTHMDMSLITLANHCRTTASRQCPPSHTSRLLPASSEQHELQLQLSACCQQHHAMHQELLQRQQELFKHRRNLTPDEINMALETHKEVFDDVRKQLVKQGDMFLGISSQLLHQHERLLEQQQRDLQQQLQFHELEVQWVLQQQAWLVTRRHAQQMNQISHILDDLQDMQGVQQQVLQQQERVLHASMRLPLQEDVAINVIKQHADYHVAEEKLRSMQKEASQKLEQFVQCMEGSYPRDAVIALAKPAPLSLQQQADSARAWLQRARQQEIMLQEQLALKSRPSEYANLQSYLASHYPSLSSVTLCHNSLTQTAQLNQQLKLLNLLPNLRSLQLLDAVRWRIPVSLAGLSQLTNLTRLSLLIQSPGSHFGDGVYGVPDAWQVQFSLEIQHLSVLTNLQSIQLRCVCGERGFFTSDNFVDVVTPLANLKHLDLGYITITPNTLPTLCKLTQLETVIVYGDFTLLSAQDFACLQPLKHLKRLELFHDGILPRDVAVGITQPPDPADLQAVAQALAGLQHLEWLNLPVSPATASVLPLVKHVPGLKELYLQNIDMNAQNFDGRLSVADSTALTVLQLDNVQLSHGVLSQMTNLVHLTQLILFNITPDQLPADALTSLYRLHQLQQFCYDTLIQPDPITPLVLSDDVIARLADHWTALKSLHFSYAQQDGEADSTLTQLSRFTGLKDLSLTNSFFNWHVVVDCSTLPTGLQSMALNNMSADHLWSLPTTCQHLWLADSLLPDEADEHIFSSTSSLPSLKTLVLKLSHWDHGPGYPLADQFVLSSLGNMTTLEALGLTLPADSDLSPLTTLTKLRKLVLDYNGLGEVVHPDMGVNTDNIFLQLQGLSTLSGLRGLWLPDAVLAAGGDALMWQHMLQPHMPYLCIRPCQTDWFWKTGFPIGACLDVGNPLEWWQFTPWNVL
eukprot:jgi/Chrzof1/3618/Cz13g02160.t1